MVNLKKLAKRVTTLRERRGWTAQELAEKIGVTYQSVWRIENAKQGVPNGNVLLELATVFDVSVDHLIGRYEDEDDAEPVDEAAAAMA